ncbi:MAG: hypothetical protein AABY22_35275 [Nanoarchaeota archaeon]
MATIEEMARELLLPDYKAKFEAFEKIAFELHKLGEKEIEMQVIKKMAGLKMLIDHCESGGRG